MTDPLTALSHSALIIDRPDLATIAVSGPDRQSWLNGMVTCDLSALHNHQAAYGLCLNKKGKIQSDVLMLSDGDQILVAANLKQASPLQAHLDHHLIMEDAEVAVAHGWKWAIAIGADLDAVQASARQAGAFAAPLRWHTHPAILIAYRNDSALRTPLTSAADFQAIRIDLGIPLFLVDFNENTYAQEARLDETMISFNKGCYLGQEVVVKTRSRGHTNRLLVRILVPSSADIASATPILDKEGEQVGSIMSWAQSATKPNAKVAYGYVLPSLAKEQLMVADHPVVPLDAFGLLPRAE